MKRGLSMIKKVAFFNPQGNFDRNDSHLTEHPDFGGQLVYVKEVAKAMGDIGIEVDIITRQIIDPDWPEFSEPYDYYPDAPNVRIVRIPFGGEKFLRKEDLWKFLPDYVEKIYEFYKSEGKFPDFVTTHYGDGGISGVLFLEKSGIPFSFTGHSLGAWKMDKILSSGVSVEEAEKKYRFSVRLLAENLSIKYASFVVCSTSQERYVQYSHKAYNTDPYSDKFKVIPPGINSSIFNTESKQEDEYVKKYLDGIIARAPVKRQKLPFIIMSSRLDRKKNHIAVVKAFMKNEELRGSANLLIVVRGVDDAFKFVDTHSTEEAEILREILNVAGNEVGISVFFANISDQRNLAGLYRTTAQRGSVFVLPAIYEPFGLAIIEAAACGLKVVATKNGGPSEIFANGEGLLIDPEDTHDIGHKIYVALTQFDAQKSLETARKYSWKNTALGYLENIQKALENKRTSIDEGDIKRFFEIIKCI
ncbi:sucrose-phosphate synthase [Fervidobacterium gondwanense DSM 13020]|uniref:sucrose-phosphate synthase n=2 Tax=Fervidobacterium gondwanense TaxID=44754 RepID=A0A1M7RR26_FERGO|nr:sucrose-phosphate synthase [Fervidobacterium gondwanense DSM 13020]